MKSNFIKFFLIIFILIFSFSCSNGKNIKDEMVLKSLPASVLVSSEMASELTDYAKNIKAIDYDRILIGFTDKSQKYGFDKHMIDLREAYNKCVTKLVEVEDANVNEKIEKMRELEELKIELDTIWKYIIHNYKI